MGLAFSDQLYISSRGGWSIVFCGRRGSRGDAMGRVSGFGNLKRSFFCKPVFPYTWEACLAL